jgi:hypothetical protein
MFVNHMQGNGTQVVWNDQRARSDKPAKGGDKPAKGAGSSEVTQEKSATQKVHKLAKKAKRAES